jgi:hypothetical protein
MELGSRDIHSHQLGIRGLCPALTCIACASDMQQRQCYNKTLTTKQSRTKVQQIKQVKSQSRDRNITIPDYQPGPPNHPPFTTSCPSPPVNNLPLNCATSCPSPLVNNLPLNCPTNQSSSATQHPLNSPVSVHTQKKTTRRTMSPVGSSYPHLHFVPSPSPSPFPTPPSLPQRQNVDNPQSTLRSSPTPIDHSSRHGHGIRSAYHLSNDIIVMTYNKASVDPNREHQYTYTSTLPAYPSCPHRPHPNHADRYKHTACPDGYVTDDSLPSLATDSS